MNLNENEKLAEQLTQILRSCYGLGDVSLRFLREGGGRTFLAEGEAKYLLKVIGNAFASTARLSVSVMRFLEGGGFPVPKTLLTNAGEAIPEANGGGELRLIVVQEYIDGEEPDLEARAEDVGALTGRLHSLMKRYPGPLVRHGKSFFIGRYLDFLRRKAYPRLNAYETLGEDLWQRVKDLPEGNCHGDLHRGNLLETPDGRLFLLDFDTVCRAPVMFDVSVMCDMTDYFRLKEKDIAVSEAVFERFVTGYSGTCALSGAERRSFHDWVAIRHFQLQATILELYGIDCIDEAFIDRQRAWLEQWMRRRDSVL